MSSQQSKLDWQLCGRQMKNLLQPPVTHRQAIQCVSHREQLPDSTCHSSHRGSCHSPGRSQSCGKGGDRDGEEVSKVIVNDTWLLVPSHAAWPVSQWVNVKVPTQLHGTMTSSEENVVFMICSQAENDIGFVLLQHPRCKIVSFCNRATHWACPCERMCVCVRERDEVERERGQRKLIRGRWLMWREQGFFMGWKLLCTCRTQLRKWRGKKWH